MFVEGMCETYSKNPENKTLQKILDITQDIKDTLLPLVNIGDYWFAVNLGLLASKRDYLHVDQ